MQTPATGRRRVDRRTLPWYVMPALGLVFAGFTPHPDSTRNERTTVTTRDAAATPFFGGVFLGDAATHPERIEHALRAHERKIGSRPALVKTFFRLDDDFGGSGWAGQVLRRIARTGSTNYTALDLRWRGAPARALLDALAAGEGDAELRRVARGLRSIDGVILIEPAWEMNGDWAYPWQGAANGGEPDVPARFAAAWRHVVELFRAEGASNVRWVFSPNVGNPIAKRALGERHWNWYAHYYPGDAWVDYVGAHGFNGPSVWGGSYQDFATLFDGPGADRMLSDLALRFPDKPIIIGEFATEEVSGRDKGAWIREAYALLHAHPQIVGAVWFDMDKEADWQVDSSPSALAAYRDAMRNPRVRPAFDERLLAPPVHLAAR